jgi:phage terminase large subunit-like protein
VARRRERPNDPVEAYARDVVDGKIVTGRLVRLACERHLWDLKTASMRGLRWDPGAAQHAIEFFKFLRHSKGRWKGSTVQLEPWQQFRVGSVFGWMRYDDELGQWVRRFRTAYHEVARKAGKALALDTPIPTPDGWTAMGDLQVDDWVFDQDGHPCRVVATMPVEHGRPCYRVSFSDGSSIVADAEHEWFTEARRNGRPHGVRLKGIPRRQWTEGYADKIRTTHEIRDTLKASEREHNHRIPVAGPLQLPSTPLPLDPYVLGCWLGDGESGGARLTCGYDDLQIIGEIAAAGVPIRETASSNDGSGLFSLSTGSRSAPDMAGSVRTCLRSLGLLGNKHIPPSYLRASEAQRLALLQGLMDTDGYISERGWCEFTTTSPVLRDGVLELVRTLGYKPRCRTGRAMLNGKDCGEKHRICFVAYRSRPAFRLQRKAARLKPAPGRRTRAAYRQIIAVEEVPSVPVRCIQVSSANGLFLAGESMVITHNSTEAAGVGLYLFDADGEGGPEVYCAATMRDQAKIVWSEAARMVSQSPALSKRITVHGLRGKNAKANMSIADAAAKFEPLGADEDTLDGLNIHAVIIDELHKHRTRALHDVLDTATGSRAQPVIWEITTAGTDQTGICFQERTYAVEVLEGRIQDDRFFAYIATIDQGDDPFDPAVWIKANPNLGVSFNRGEMQRLADVARQMPSELNKFLRYYMNVWTQQEEARIPLPLWDENAGIVDADALKGRICYGGLDLSSVSDFTAWVLLFPSDEDPELVDVLCRFWVPQARLADLKNRYRDQYQVWEREKLLVPTPGEAVDHDFIVAQVLKDAETFQLVDLNIDRLFQAHQVSVKLGQEGLTVVGMGQGFVSMASPYKEFERRLLRRKIRHGGNKVLRWMAGNLAVEEDAAGNLKPSKRHAQGKIDGIVGLVMALDRVMRREDEWVPRVGVVKGG